MEDLGLSPSCMPAVSYMPAVVFLARYLASLSLSHSICEMETASLISLISCEDSIR